MAALARIDAGAYANLVLPELLSRSGLDERGRAFATELVYGTTRLRRACDWLIEPWLLRDPPPDIRAALRLGAYQLAFLHTPPHAAVSETVAAAPARARGMVNAVLRRLSMAHPAGRPIDWPDDATRLSYPDWIVEQLRRDLGPDRAEQALTQMNEAATVSARPDGYVQDRGSQWVVEVVLGSLHPGSAPPAAGGSSDAGGGLAAGGSLAAGGWLNAGGSLDERLWIADVCAGPGGKATGMALGADGVAGARVVALDVRLTRAGLVAGNAARVGADRVFAVVADARTAPLRPAVFDVVLVDAPCSGLGVLRRRPDARWRVQPSDVATLAALQRDLLDEAACLVRPGGVVAYSVCTLTSDETTRVAAWMAERRPDWTPLAAPPAPWEAIPAVGGARLLPQAAGTDGMFLAQWRRPASGGAGP